MVAQGLLAISQLQEALTFVSVTRYLTGAGLIALLYDHLLTFSNEISLIWKAPPSVAKYAFLLNRYIVPTMLTTVMYQMTLFDPSLTMSTDVSKSAAMVSVVSIGIANILVLWRVILLWENNKIVAKLLVGAFVLSFFTTCTMMVVTLVTLWDALEYNPIAGMCVLSRTTPTLVATWASPMFFEILVLLLTFWNALSRPRTAQQALTRALHKDGITFFFATATMRIVNTSLAATGRVELTMLGVFFVWAMVTLILNRSVLRMQYAEVLNAYFILKTQQLELQVENPTIRAASPFGIHPQKLGLPDDFDDDSDDDLSIKGYIGYDVYGSRI